MPERKQLMLTVLPDPQPPPPDEPPDPLPPEPRPPVPPEPEPRTERLSRGGTRIEPGPLPIKGGRDTIEPLAAEQRRSRRPRPPTRRLPPVRPMDAVVLVGGLVRTIGIALGRLARRLPRGSRD